jgi:predicted MFS family arabinose efflux permease
VGLLNTMLAPCYLAGVLGGLVVDALGFKALFFIGAFCALTGVAVMAFLVQDPRTIRPARIPIAGQE